MFAYRYYRDKHLKYTRCVDRGDRKFPCHLCSRSFEKRDRLRIHVLHVHEKHRPHKVRRPRRYLGVFGGRCFVPPTAPSAARPGWRLSDTAGARSVAPDVSRCLGDTGPAVVWGGETGPGRAGGFQYGTGTHCCFGPQHLPLFLYSKSCS